MDKTHIIFAGVGLVVGGGIGYGIAYKTLGKKFANLAEEEIQSVREAYGKADQLHGSLFKKPDLDVLAKHVVPDVIEPVVQTVDETIVSEGYTSGAPEEMDVDAFRRTHGRVPTTEELVEHAEEGSVDLETRNLFSDANTPDPEDIGEGIPETPPRSPDRPYVVSLEEWGENELDFEKITLTYWADDDVLADDANREVRNKEEIVGIANLSRWGFLSKDPDIVYVQNEKVGAVYEITKDERNFAEVVHGIDPDLQEDRRRRMRGNDE